MKKTILLVILFLFLPCLSFAGDSSSLDFLIHYEIEKIDSPEERATQRIIHDMIESGQRNREENTKFYERMNRELEDMREGKGIVIGR